MVARAARTAYALESTDRGQAANHAGCRESAKIAATENVGPGTGILAVSITYERYANSTIRCRLA